MKDEGSRVKAENPISSFIPHPSSHIDYGQFGHLEHQTTAGSDHDQHGRGRPRCHPGGA